MIKIERHLLIALLYFAFAAGLGLIMRLSFVTPVDWNFKYLLHTHSHVALLGWVYTAITSLFYYMFLQNSGVKRRYTRLFYFTQFTILGMLLSFPLQGYALFSIIFSTLFLFASYRFVFVFFKYVPNDIRKNASFIFAKWSLYLLVFSSLGPWTLGAIMKTLGSTSIWYHNAIYFYLHFLYNGFFTLALMAAFFYLLEYYGFALADKKTKSSLIWFVTSVFLTFFLSVLWSEPPYIFYSLATIGAIVQVVAYIDLAGYVRDIWPDLKKKVLPVTAKLFQIAGVILVIKILLQTASAFPEIAAFAAYSKSLIIGYLHMVFLGLISLLIFAFLHQFNLIKLNKVALWLYGLGFLFSEFILFYQGLYFEFKLPVLKQYPLLLFITSGFMFLGLVLMIIKSFSQKRAS